jgi:hypothetical protein
MASQRESATRHVAVTRYRLGPAFQGVFALGRGRNLLGVYSDVALLQRSRRCWMPSFVSLLPSLKM